MNRFLKMSLAGVLSVLTLAAAPDAAYAADDKPLRIGVIPSVANQATEIAIAEAKKRGLKVELVEFSDWVMPNTGVAEGALDANFFQHDPFLQLFNQSRGTQLRPIAYGYSTTIGLFSKKLKRGDAIPDGATIAIPNDPVNAGRALLLLNAMGLIQLRDGADHRASTEDIVANPKKIKLVQLEGSQSARSFDDVTASVTYTTFAKHAGIDEKDGLAFDNTDPENVRRYAIRWVATPEGAKNPRLLEFIELYQQSPEVKAKLRELYGDLIDFPW
jgi:D-methionine transport system substrate-binding protein